MFRFFVSDDSSKNAPKVVAEEKPCKSCKLEAKLQHTEMELRKIKREEQSKRLRDDFHSKVVSFSSRLKCPKCGCGNFSMKYKVVGLTEYDGKVHAIIPEFSLRCGDAFTDPLLECVCAMCEHHVYMWPKDKGQDEEPAGAEITD